MLYRRNGTASVQIDLGQNDGSRTTVYPGGLIDIPDTVARDLKNIYGADLAVADDEDRTQKTEVSLTSGQVLTLSTVPVQLVLTPGAGKAVVVEKVAVALDYNSAAYETNTDLEIRYDSSTAGDAGGAEVTAVSLDAVLLATADRVAVVDGLTATDELTCAINKGITAKVATDDPATGNSPLRITTRYKVVSL